MLVDDFLPVFDISDTVATVVHADLEATWDALMEVDLIHVGRSGRRLPCSVRSAVCPIS